MLCNLHHYFPKPQQHIQWLRLFIFYLSDFGLSNGQAYSHVPRLCLLTGERVGGIEKVLKVFLPPNDVFSRSQQHTISTIYSASGTLLSPSESPDSLPESFRSRLKATFQDIVKLSCSYGSSSEDVDLYWYRQYPNRALQYLLQKGARSRGHLGHSPDPQRFESTATRISTELRTTELRLSDTALYYCALRDWEGPIMTFSVFEN
uniref:Ig-like domain-containing protein n=1 Tax=Pygocentrus nattereri TaxID=42514 RepID=A0AAR2L9T8_PYGNA